MRGVSPPVRSVADGADGDGEEEEAEGGLEYEDAETGFADKYPILIASEGEYGLFLFFVRADEEHEELTSTSHRIPSTRSTMHPTRLFLNTTFSSLILGKDFFPEQMDFSTVEIGKV